MEIVRPLDNIDLVIVYDMLPQESLEILRKYSIAARYYNNGPNGPSDNERLALGYKPEEKDLLLESKAFQVLKEVKRLSELLLQQEYPDLNLTRFAHFSGISIRNQFLQPSMKPHVDGPPEYNNPEHGINNLGANLYINDDFQGGELYYPELNFTFKPKSNSFVMHRGTPLFLHGVAEVTSGWRISFGVFAYEHYDLPPLAVGLDSDS